MFLRKWSPYTTFKLFFCPSHPRPWSKYNHVHVRIWHRISSLAFLSLISRNFLLFVMNSLLLTNMKLRDNHHHDKDSRPHTEKTRILFPFKLNGIWSWWAFSFRFSNQMEIYLVQIRQENCHHDHIPFNLKLNIIRVFSV